MSLNLFTLLLAVGLIGCAVPESEDSTPLKKDLPVALQDDPVDQVAKALVQALNSSDPKELEKFATNAADPSVAASVPLDRRIEVLQNIRSALGKIEIVGLMAPDDETLIVDVKTEKKGAQQFKITLSGPPKYGVKSIMVGEPGSFLKGPSFFENITTLEALAKQAREEGGAPALAIGRAKSDGAPEIAVTGLRQAGTDDAVLVGDLWLVGSIGKSMTATMVGILVDQGKLKWSTTVGEAMADCPMKEAYKSVTLAQLLQHRGGIPQDLGVRPGSALTPEDLEGFAQNAKTGSELRERYARNILSREPVGPIGNFRYSNASYALAVVMAERASGKQFPDLMSELLFKPLGMASARIDMPGSTGMPGADGQNHGHRLVNGKPSAHALAFKPLAQAFAGAGGGIAMTIGDLLKYGQFHLNGLLGRAKLLSQANFDVLHMPGQGPGEAYGCGWSISEMRNGEKLHHHNGSDGTFQADLAIYPNGGVVFACIQNMGVESNQPMPEKVVASLVRSAAKR